MLPKRYRLRKNIEFVATYAQKKYVSDMYLTLNLGKPKPFEDFVSKVAFVVSKKIDKRATVRNKIKRRMRDAYKMLIKENPACIKWMSLIFSAHMEQILKKAIQKYD